MTTALDDPGFRVFLAEFEQATTGFINGGSTRWRQLASQREDVTLMGGWGICERGWERVGARYDWAASRFRPSGAAVDVEYLASGLSGDLAFTVTLERSIVQLADQPAAAPMTLRVTHLFRCEHGEWKLLHRHADPLVNTTAAAAVLNTDNKS